MAPTGFRRSETYREVHRSGISVAEEADWPRPGTQPTCHRQAAAGGGDRTWYNSSDSPHTLHRHDQVIHMSG